jgi:hypothetical protein
MRALRPVLLAAAFGAALVTLPATVGGQSDPAVVMMQRINARLARSGMKIAAESIEFFSIGDGRPAARIHQQGFRWVANDTRRLAQGDNLTYLVDQSDGNTSSGLTTAQTEAAIDRAYATWNAQKALQKINLVKLEDPGQDPDIFDAFVEPEGSFGGFGFPFFADIVNAGWLPREFFEAAGGPGGGRGILAFSITFVFTEDDGETPTDINADNYLDAAMSEVYYNDTFGNAATDRVGNPWAINQELPAVDVETVALHENAHSLGLGHFGPNPIAVMNPSYAGPRHLPFASDRAAMNALYASWPK